MGWKMVVIQTQRSWMRNGVVIEKNEQGDLFVKEGQVMDVAPCWEMLYDCSVNVTEPDALTVCKAWIENNKVDGCRYLITKMFIYEIEAKWNSKEK